MASNQEPDDEAGEHAGDDHDDEAARALIGRPGRQGVGPLVKRLRRAQDRGLGEVGLFAQRRVGVPVEAFRRLDVAALGRGHLPVDPPHREHGASSFGGSFLLGAGVAVGWTPCIGPTLGAILTLAAASQTVWSGAALLVAHGIGMAVPILAIGLGLSRIRPVTRALTRHHPSFQVVSGLLIVGVGVLVASNAFGRVAGLVPWPY